MNHFPGRFITGLFALPLVYACSSGAKFQVADYEQILPRGSIAAITEPVYIAADQAEIAANSYVLGVVIAGQARAYSLNLLNRHEVVNDKIGDQACAAVW